MDTQPARTGPAEGVVRLQKYLAQCGVASRRRSEQLINEGRVLVNDVPARLGDNIRPGVDSVVVDGTSLDPDRHVYLLLNKPKGVITSVTDTHGRRTVLDCIGRFDARLFPVGRLDMDVEGALLLTNDGELAYRLTHPKYEVRKTYIARLQGSMPEDTARALAHGVMLEDGMTSPAQVKILRRSNKSTLVRLTLHEGRKREVKRMCAHVGHQVLELRRAAVGTVRVKGLRPGGWRHLTEQEVRSLRHITGLGGGPPRRSEHEKTRGEGR